MPNDITSRGLPLPHQDNIAREDAARVRSALQQVDSDLNDLFAAIAPQATEAVAGRVRLATAAEAAAGTTSAAVATVKRVADMIAALKTLVDLKAAAANAALTGVPTAPTAALGTNTDQIATMAALRAMRNDLVNGAGPALDQLNEFAAAINNDPNFSNTVLGLLAGKQPLHANLTTLAGLAAVANLSSFAGLTGAANKVPYFIGPGALSHADLSAFARTIIDDTSGAAMFATMGTTASITTPGYIKFPNGLILQWGYSGGVGGGGNIFFPVQFPNGVAAVVGQMLTPATNTTVYSLNIVAWYVNYFAAYTVYSQNSNAQPAGESFFWFAVGW